MALTVETSIVTEFDIRGVERPNPPGKIKVRFVDGSKCIFSVERYQNKLTLEVAEQDELKSMKNQKRRLLERAVENNAPLWVNHRIWSETEYELAMQYVVFATSIRGPIRKGCSLTLKLGYKATGSMPDMPADMKCLLDQSSWPGVYQFEYPVDWVLPVRDPS